MPATVDVADGVTQDEAVALALWNDTGFGAALAELEIARAEVARAGLLQDPVLSLLFPAGRKQYEWVLGLPLEELWLRPRRIEAAQHDVKRVAESLVKHGLDLVRDVRMEFAIWSHARRTAPILAERAELVGRLLELEEVRLRAGESAPLSVEEARVRARRAAEEARLRTYRLDTARERVVSRLGFEGTDVPDLVPLERVEIPVVPGAHSLVEVALASRPEVRAAELQIEAAAVRAGLAREEAWKVSALIDGNEEGKSGSEVGPGLQLTIPIFDGGRATEAVATAEVDRAAAVYRDVRRRVALDVRASRIDFERAVGGMAAWREEIVPGSERAVEFAERAKAAGGIDASRLVEARVALIDARLGAADAALELHRSVARLEHSLGHRLTTLEREGTP